MTEIAIAQPKTPDNQTRGVGALIEAHRLAMASLWGLNDAPDTPEVDTLAGVIAEVERETLEALALAPCGTEPAYAQKMTYLVPLSHEPVDDILLEARFLALRTATEAWLQEHAPRLAA